MENKRWKIRDEDKREEKGDKISGPKTGDKRREGGQRQETRDRRQREKRQETGGRLRV